MDVIAFQVVFDFQKQRSIQNRIVLFMYMVYHYLYFMIPVDTDKATSGRDPLQHQTCMSAQAEGAVDHSLPGLQLKALENRMESVYREAIADLFAMPRDIDHVVEMLKLREIYRHLSNAADRGDQAANVLGDIVVKKM